jgi:hypothetical protein
MSVTIVASAALSNNTPTSTITDSSTATMNVVVAIVHRNPVIQMPVLTPKMIHTPNTIEILTGQFVEMNFTDLRRWNQPRLFSAGRKYQVVVLDDH